MAIELHIRYLFLDSSALVKYLLHPEIKEAGSQRIFNYCRTPGNFPYSNDTCISETLGVLKAKLLRNELSHNGYMKRVYLLQRWLEHKTLQRSTFDLWDQVYWDKGMAFAKKYDIDFLDAIQIVDVLEGTFRKFCGESKTVMITADKKLRDAARAEGVRVWYPIDEVMPEEVS